MRRKLVFYGFMAAVLVFAGVDAASAAATQIASKAYVDAQNDTQNTNITNLQTDISDMETQTHASATYATISQVGTGTLNTTATTIVDAINELTASSTNVSGKQDKLGGAGQGGKVVTASETLGTVSYTGIDTTVAASSANLITSGAVNTAITTATTGLATTASLGNLAYQNSVAAGDIDAGAIVNADISATAAIARTKLAADVQTSLSKADSAITDVSGKEDTINKTSTISSASNSATKYTSESAVIAYALPKPSAACTAPSAQCVLSIDSSGVITWVDVTKSD
ncbi:MAG: hypothetical protein LBD50_03550 [Rickettsiales bacterium]|jgi:hypothetical protein|nr:hypothetical protein [Rickettsiales bacterium]